MINQKLKKAVVKEALLLRKHATQEEKRNLKINKLDGQSGVNCIYGLMTGWCSSSRAVELLNKCAIPFSFSHNVYTPTTKRKFTNDINGFRSFYSPIEFYICQKGAKIEDLVNLIKS
jgi:hypothetical protein